MYEVENPVVRDELWRKPKSYFYNRYHYDIDDDDEPDWDSMDGGHDNPEDRD